MDSILFVPLPAFIAEASLCLWLLTEGVNVDKWRWAYVSGCDLEGGRTAAPSNTRRRRAGLEGGEHIAPFDAAATSNAPIESSTIGTLPCEFF